MLRLITKWPKRCFRSPKNLVFSERRPQQLAATCRTYASIVNLDDHPSPGEPIHGFRLNQTKHVPELQLTAFHLQHEKTGAEYLHIARDDNNNVFSIGFKTNPPDATGVPHILEHTTLCGSKRYPVRDPFFKMLRRSLSNFMNAFTSSDHTSYPFATTNAQDFRNLLSVYLDATLHPLLKESDFRQEGWRIGPESSQAIAEGSGEGGVDNGLVFKGIVYNEMKGQMSDASYLFYIKFQEHIFPSINNSGGDPQKMTDLTYNNLVKFHSNTYTPSNAKIFTYGDIPLTDHAKDIDSHLSGFNKTLPDKTNKLPMSLENGPVFHTVYGPVDSLLDPTMQYKTSTSWILGDTADIIETFSLSVMSSLLLGGYGSPLYQSLIESGLGPDFTSNTGFDDSARRSIFTVGLNGVKRDDVPKVQSAIQTKLQEVYSKGFEKGKVDGILHQIELTLRNKTAGFGLNLMQRLESNWFNGINPLESLAWNDIVKGSKARLANGRYLEELLQKYLLNDRTLTFTMEPSLSYTEQLKKEENSRLASKISEAARKVSGEASVHEEFRNQELKLLKEQAKAPDEDLSSLPSLHVKDIPRQMDRKEIRDTSCDKVKVQWREASTNGLTYFRAINALEGVPTELRMLIPLFTNSILRLGTKGKTIEELEDLIKLKTGGVDVTYHSSPLPNDPQTSVEGLSFSGYALDENVPAMYELLRTLVQETNFDGPEAESKVRQLLQADASGALDAIASSGHSYARRFAESGLSVQGLLTEQVAGLTQVQQIANLANRDESKGLEDIMSKLKDIQSFAISNSSRLRTAITCEPKSASANEAALVRFLSTLSQNPSPPENTTLILDTPQSTFCPLPYQVYYTAASLPTVSYGDPAGAPLQILSQLITHKHLHHEIREKGGAYGGGAYARGLSGFFGFYSYRDPNPQNSLSIIRNAGRWARDKEWTDQDLEEAKLSTFQSVDAPQSVSDEGMTRFLSGVDEEMEQRRREQLLDVTKEDVRDIAQKYLVEGLKDMRVAVLGEKKDWVKEAEGWTIKSVELSSLSQTAGASDLSPGDLN